METIKNILVGIDGSKSALNAVNYAIKLAKELNAKLELIYVIRYAIGNIDGGVFPYELEQFEKENAIKLIKKIKKNHPEIKIKDIELVGQPLEEINNAIDYWQPDLFVIGHHTHNFLENLFAVSLEKKILNNLKVPLLILPQNYDF